MTTSRPLPEFEFDDRKSRINQLRHGIDFVEAQALWLDGSLLTGRARESDERRLLVIGRIGEQHWAAVITHRERRVRIISVRRARKKEWPRMKSSDFDKKSDDGRDDVIDDIDPTSWTRPNRDVKRVSVDLPLWMVEALTEEAKRLGVTRQSLIKVWLAERVDQMWRASATDSTAGDSQTG